MPRLSASVKWGLAQTQRGAACLAEGCWTLAHLCCASSQLELLAQPAHSSLCKLCPQFPQNCCRKRGCTNGLQRLLTETHTENAGTQGNWMSWVGLLQKHEAARVAFRSSRQFYQPTNLTLESPEPLALPELPGSSHMRSGSKAQ